MRLDHVAHPTRDPQQTHRFYSQVMGLKLAQAYAGRELLLVYTLPEGGNLAFSASRDDLSSASTDLPWERHHVGLTLSTRAEFDSWLARLKQFSVPHQVIDDERIYFSDPDGMVLELEVESSTPVDPRAIDTLSRWQNG